MFKKIFSFFVDLVGDGYGLVSLLAPLLSIAFTVAKALDMEWLGHLRELSYAWAFVPLTLWIFVAYVRRRAADLKRNASSPAVPDLRIKDLFYHIRPDDLLNGNHELVGDDVLDKLSTMQLLAWGRRENKRPLELINYVYWSQARFTYSFLADGDHDADVYSNDPFERTQLH